MAVNRTKLFDGIANGAAWDAGVVFNRTNGIPLDKWSVFQTVEDAEAYASSNPVAYPGQIITVVPESGYPTVYEINADGTIREVGIQPDWNQTDDTQPDYIKNKPNMLGVETATELPADNTLQANIMYFIGEVTSLSIGFPTTANMGDLVYISFTTGATTPTFTFTTDNHIGLDTINRLQNYRYELIGMWNGQEWMFVIHEVEL